jgi:hypothetical protein
MGQHVRGVQQLLPHAAEGDDPQRQPAEPPDLRVIDAPLHVDEPEFVVALVPGEPLRRQASNGLA